MTKLVIRVAFRKNSNKIYAGFTSKNITLVGTVVYSQNLEMSYYDSIIEARGEEILEKLATVCIPNESIADQVIEELNAIQENREVRANGYKYPFCFLTVDANSDIIFNQGTNGEPDRLSLLDITDIQVSSNAPNEVYSALNINGATRTRRLRTATTSYYERKRNRSSKLGERERGTEMSNLVSSNSNSSLNGRKRKAINVKGLF